MCRWLAYSGSPVRLDDLLYRPTNSLVMQSKHSRLGAETTNGDGFGVGWYGAGPTPGVFRSTEPAWHDRNLRELAAQASAGRVFAHIRATTGTAVQQTNCHPFRHGRWLWMHNGLLTGFLTMKRDLAMAVDPNLYPEIEGSTDSELFFYLALTFGLEQDPRTAVAEAVGFIEDIATLRAQYPDHPMLQGLSDDTRLVVSEPLGDLRGAWQEVPDATCVVVHGGEVELNPFVPAVPSVAGRQDRVSTA